MSWYLDNAVELNKKSPYTFYVPSFEVIERLKVGDLVKLIFTTEKSEIDGFRAERMWVEITDRKEDNFVGKLDNEPYHLPLKSGEEVSFKVENICDTEYEDPKSSDWGYYFDFKVTVSSDVFVKREFNFLLRDHPKGENDSGWVVLSGYEDDEFLGDSDNYQIISIGVIFNIDDSILEFIDEPVLCAFEKNDKGEFYKIEDYDWDTYLNE